MFQTYYGVKVVDADNGFYANMESVREAAAETGSGLVDHLKRWDAFKAAKPEIYATLMHDNAHVNFRGNLVMGLDIARHF